MTPKEDVFTMDVIFLKIINSLCRVFIVYLILIQIIVFVGMLEFLKNNMFMPVLIVIGKIRELFVLSMEMISGLFNVKVVIILLVLKNKQIVKCLDCKTPFSVSKKDQAQNICETCVQTYEEVLNETHETPNESVVCSQCGDSFFDENWDGQIHMYQWMCNECIHDNNWSYCE